MSETEKQQYILFFSEYCDYCKDLLREINKFQLEGIFSFFNVDTQRSQLPNFVNEVPCVFLPEFNHVLTGEEVFGLLNHMKKELGLIPEQKQQSVQKPMQPQNSYGMQPHPSEMQQINISQNEPPPRMIPQNTGPQQGGPQQSGPQQSGPPQSGPPQGGPQQGGPPQGGPQPDDLEGYNICEMGMCSDSYSYIDNNTMIQHNFEMISDSDKIAKNKISDMTKQQSSDPRKGSMKEQKISDSKYQAYLSERNAAGPKPIERH